jgi:hypothetical protein
VAVRRDGDAVEAAAAPRIKYRYRARSGSGAAIGAGLTREPEHALAIKACRVEVGVAPLLMQTGSGERD